MGNYRLGMEMNEGYGTYLAHFGIKGQKWGVRRFQNPDRTWTEAGKERYGNSGDKKTASISIDNISDSANLVYNMSKNRRINKMIDRYLKKDEPLSNAIKTTTNQYVDSTNKLNTEFYKYDNMYTKEQGHEWTGDGTEAHEYFKKTYPEYKKIADKQEKAEREWYKTILAASKAGKSVSIDIPDYKYTSEKYGTSYSIDNKAAVIMQKIAKDKKIEFFYDLLEMRTWTENGKEQSYIPYLNLYL